jgi:hypothetical protein
LTLPGFLIVSGLAAIYEVLPHARGLELCFSVLAQWSRPVDRCQATEQVGLPDIVYCTDIGSFPGPRKTFGFEGVALFNTSYEEEVRQLGMSHFCIVVYHDYFVHYPTFLKTGTKSFTFWDSGKQRKRRLRPMVSKGTYDRVIAIGWLWSVNYAHSLLDLAGPLFGFPERLLSSSWYVSARMPRPFMWETLKWLHMNQRVIILGYREYCKAHEIYRYDSGYHFAPFFISRMRKHVKLMLGLDEVPPSRYAFMNREGARNIINLRAVMLQAKREYTRIHWEEIVPLSLFGESAILFNRLNLLFTPHGAGLANTLFMQAGSVICEVQGDREVAMFTDISKVTGVNHVVSRIMEMEHHGKVGANIDIRLAMKMLEIGLSFL